MPVENLGTMDPDEILQLLSGSIACFFVILVFIIVYVVISRRGKRAAKGTGLGVPSFRQEASMAEYRAPTSPPADSSVASTSSGSMVTQPSPGDDTSSIDVSARLVGTGREAWLEEGASSFAGPSVAEEHSPDHGQEVLRLLRDPLTGQIWVQMAGLRYRSLNDIRDRAVGGRVLASVTHLLRFSKGMIAVDQGVVTLKLPPCDAVKVPTAFGVLSGARESDELMRLMSDPDQNRFCVHVVGRCYHQLADVGEQETGRYILEAITRLLQFSNGMLATNDGVGAVPVPSLRLDVHTPLPKSTTEASQISGSVVSPASTIMDPAPRSTQTSYPPPDSAEPIDDQERFLHQLKSQSLSPQAEAPIERPSLIGSLRRARRGASSAETLPSLNLADEIDRIFQRKLVASGNTSVGAKVETNPDGGVRIRIGMVCYDSPDEVPDPYLREMLKLSIAEWEQG
jgi:hypothetical protein